MFGRGIHIGAIAALCAAVSCSSSPEPEPARGAVARFDLTASGALRWGAVPFPSDLYLSADGTVDLASPPALVQDEPVWQTVVEGLRRRRGFCTTCNVYFGIDGALDRTKLPKSAGPSDTATASDAVVMIDADPTSPEHGKIIPLQLEWNGDDRVLAVRPVPWIVLRKNRKYAVALTSKVRDVEGRPLRPADTFSAARDGGGDAAALRARKVVGPALDELVKAGVPRGEIVSVAAFTTGDPTVDALAARKLVRAGTPPAPVVDKVWSDAALDELLGVPVDGTLGHDAPAVDPAVGPNAIVHDLVAHVVHGSFESPHVRKGPSTEGGVPVRGPDGALAAEGTEKVPFFLSIPKSADLAKLPVVVVIAGAGSSAAFGLALANSFARAGVAVLAIDPPCQGARTKDAVDKLTEPRGAGSPPDGVLEGDNTSGALRGLGLIGPAAGAKGNPDYLLGFSLQTIADLLTAVRMAKEGDLAALHATAPLATLAFDPANIFMLGNHLSTVHVTAVSAVEPELAGVMLNAFLPAASDILFEAPGNRVLAVNFSVALAVPLDLDETVRRYAFHPSLDLMRWVLEPGEGRAFFPYVYVDPIVAGPRPDLLVQNGKLDEYVTEEQSSAAIVALGIPSIAPMQLAPVTQKPAPLAVNVTSAGATVTAGGSVFGDGMARMLWRTNEDSNFEPPFTPPAKGRSTPLAGKNPIGSVHAQLEAFVRARIEKGHATIVAP